MKIKIIEKTHELDLEDALNEFVEKENPDIQDLQYQVTMTSHNGELEYSFSCMIVYLP
ncbi:sporulation protein Cse60 [Candidatus Stoquefichus massiliensis]|uniref:sporulation protein Cse60 n=1 Tax=Candidatus Stoquefichus massiliensis TaxID=1470350 RepID=UPI0004B86ACE|nr:sporulation protein Cse60 [Candidatus Stoquefichus massiliensis]